MSTAIDNRDLYVAQSLDGTIICSSCSLGRGEGEMDQPSPRFEDAAGIIGHLMKHLSLHHEVPFEAMNESYWAAY